MPDNRPMPLDGEERIEADPVLGRPVDNFPSRRLVVLVYGWSLLIGISLLINLAVWNIWDNRWVDTIVVGFSGTLALVIGWWVLHQWNREVILYERGFSYREGSENVPFLYAEVRGVRLQAEQLAYFGGLLRRTVFRITVITHAGEHIHLNNNIYRRADEMGDQLLKTVCEVQRPLVLLHLENGDAIPFAEGFSVQAEGLRVAADILENADADVLLPWRDFGGHRVERRQLLLLTASGQVWFSVPLIDVENLPLLLDLLKQNRQDRQTLQELPS